MRHYRSISTVSPTQVQSFIRKDQRMINNQTLALIADIPVSMAPYFMTFVDHDTNPIKTDKVRMVFMINRILGGIGFPGGKAEKTDATLFDTALREFHEEVGLSLKPFIDNPDLHEYVIRDALFLHDTNSNCLSGLHIVKIAPATFFQFLYHVNGHMQKQAEELVIDFQTGGNNKQTLLRELCSVFPVPLHYRAMPKNLNAAAFSLVQQQMEFLYEDFLREYA